MAVFVAHNSHALHQLKKTCPYSAKIIVQVKNCISRLSGNPPYQTFWHLYGEPVYTQCSEEMMALSEELRKQLDQETAALLDKLEDVFVKRETASVEGAFREGVRVAILLALDLLPPSGPSQN